MPQMKHTGLFIGNPKSTYLLLRFDFPISYYCNHSLGVGTYCNFLPDFVWITRLRQGMINFPVLVVHNSAIYNTCSVVVGYSYSIASGYLC